MLEIGAVILAAIFVLASFAIQIYILIKMAQEQGGLHAVLGFIFPPYAYLWGWLNAKRLEIIDIMAFWTFVGIAAIVFPVVVGLTSALRLGDGLLQAAPQALTGPESFESLELSGGPVGDEPVYRGSLAIGQQVNGTIDDLFAIDEWSFDGQAGQVVSIQCAPVAGADTDPRVHLFSPSGEVVASDDDGGGDVSALISNFTLPESGTYRIQVDVFFTGPYVLAVTQ